MVYGPGLYFEDFAAGGFVVDVGGRLTHEDAGLVLQRRVLHE